VIKEIKIPVPIEILKEVVKNVDIERKVVKYVDIP